jgi:hypothetical protein
MSGGGKREAAARRGGSRVAAKEKWQDKNHERGGMICEPRKTQSLSK